MIISNCYWDGCHVRKNPVSTGHYVQVFRVVGKVYDSVNKKNETLRNVLLCHNTRSNEVEYKENKPDPKKKSRVYFALFCFVTTV